MYIARLKAAGKDASFYEQRVAEYERELATLPVSPTPSTSWSSLAEPLPGGMAGGGYSSNPGDFGWCAVNGVATPPTLAALEAGATAYAAYMTKFRYSYGQPNPLSNQGASAAYNRALERVMGGPIIPATPYEGPGSPTFDPATSPSAAGLNIPGEHLGAGENPFAVGTLGAVDVPGPIAVYRPIVEADLVWPHEVTTGIE